MVEQSLSEYLYQNRGDYEWLENEDRENQWKTPMFDFCRAAKAHPDLHALPADVALRVVADALAVALEARGDYAEDPDDKDEIFRIAFNCRSEDFEPVIEFVSIWPRIKYPVGHGPLDLAVERGDRSPLTPLRQHSKNYRRFVSTAGWLQKIRGTDVIYLPVHHLAPMFGCTAQSISRYRDIAEEEGLLAFVKKHTYFGDGGLATEFKFMVQLFDANRIQVSEGDRSAFLRRVNAFNAGTGAGISEGW
jgi:hypothetical protein